MEGIQGAAMSCFLIMVGVMKVCSFGKIPYATNLRSVTLFMTNIVQ